MRFYLLALIIILLGCNSSDTKFQRISDVNTGFIVQLGQITSWNGLFPKHGVSPLQFTLDFCSAFERDNEGNLYCSGFTNGWLGDQGGGNADAFVVKFNDKGEIIWVSQLGANTKDPVWLPGDPGYAGSNAGEEICSKLHIDDNQNVYCAGNTTGNLSGPGTFTGGAGRDAIVYKLDKDGDLQWVSHIGTTSMDTTLDVHVEPNGNVFALLYTEGDLTGVHVARTDADMVIVKFDNDGNELAKFQLGDLTNAEKIARNLTNLGVVSTRDFPYDIKSDGNGNLLILALTEGDLVADNPTLGADYDVVLWKIDQNLNTIWIKQYPLIGSQNIQEMEVDEAGYIYIAGRTTESIADVNANPVGQDAFVMKFTPDGELLKMGQIGTNARVPGGDTSKNERCTDLAIDRDGNVYCTGGTYGSLGERNAHPTFLTEDLFVAKWDRNLKFVSVFQFGASTSYIPGSNLAFTDFGSGIVIDYFGNLYIGGMTYGNLVEAQGFTPGQENLGDLFILKMDMSTLDLNKPSL